MKKYPIYFLVIVVLAGACNDKDVDDPGSAPVLPPASSMSPEYESLSNNSGDEGGRVNEVVNWSVAASSVGIYSAILKISLAVPVTAFKLALDQQPTFDSDNGVWVWQYDISVPRDASYDVRLTAAVDGSKVAWTGYISKNGGFTDFVWFTGESDREANSGTWTLFESPENPTAWLVADWAKSAIEGVANVTFEVEKTGENLGSSISYEANNTTELDRKVVIVDTRTDNHIEVEWNKAEKFGRIKSEVFFEDSLYHCWDKNRNDTDCE